MFYSYLLKGIFVLLFACIIVTSVLFKPHGTFFPSKSSLSQPQEEVELLALLFKGGLRPYYNKFCQLDRARTKRLRNVQTSSSTPDDFHTMVMDTYDTVCKLKSRLGGSFQNHCKFMDGHKYICMDGLVEDIRRGECLIYSFGISNDWTFDDAIAEMGCKVLAYDPTVTYEENRSANVKFKKWGVVGPPSTDQNYKTLGEILRINGHSDTKISYLKIDIEGHEIAGLPVWLASGALNHVEQIALEIHLDAKDRENSTKRFFQTFKDVQLLGNFRIINWDPNSCWKTVHSNSHYQDIFEILLKKITASDECVM